MFPTVNLLPGAIYEIMASASATGSVALADRYGLMAAVMDETISEDERRCANRLLRAVLRGRIQVSDRLCAA